MRGSSRSRSASRRRWGHIAASTIATVLILAAAPALRAAAPLILQPYADPDKLFTIEYPIGWHVKRTPNAGTAFYRDDPDEGTKLEILPSAPLKGEMDAAQVMRIILTGQHKRYPDLKVAGGQQRHPDNVSTIVEVALMWTNSHQVAMKGWSKVGARPEVGKGFTNIVYEGYQAPASTFDATELVFGRMLQTLKYGPGK